MFIILDIIILGIVILNVILGRKHGFVKTAIELLGWLAVVILGSYLANAIAGGIYDLFISGTISDSVKNAVINSGSDKLLAAISEFFDGLPGIVSGALYSYGITVQSLSNAVINAETADTVAITVVDVLRQPIVSFISLVLTIIIFIVGIFLVRLLANACDGIVSKLPLVSGLNSFLGAVVGLIKGVIISVLIVWILATIVAMTTRGILGITQEVIEKTFVFSKLSEFNPIL